MRTIQRTSPPQCLAGQPASQSWDDFARTLCHPTVGKSLRAEQHDICCYCELELSAAGSHIEHMEPRSRNPTRTYDYGNLAASCNGARAHCGHYKDSRNSPHSFDAAHFSPPHDPLTTGLFRYLPEGSVVPAAEQVRPRATYMIGYLGLDSSRLRELRRAHARGLIDTLGPNPAADVVAWAKGYFLHPDTSGCLRQFHSLSRAILEP